MGYFLPHERPGMPDPREFFERLKRLPEHAHFTEAEARVEFLMRGHPEQRGGRQVLGTVFRPDVQGRLREVFLWLLEEKFGPGDDAGGDEEKPPMDFLIVIDADYWLESDDRVREILVYHEMCHVQPAFDKMGNQRFSKETGLPVLTLAGHDVEEFSAVVQRYGTYSQDLKTFIQAAAEGDAAQS